MTSTRHVAAAPPLDPELDEPLQRILAEMVTRLTPALIADRRARTVAGSLTDAAIRRDGRFTVQELSVPGSRWPS
jgi:hypothetical protein